MGENTNQAQSLGSAGNSITRYYR
ncbi:sterol-sensing domain of SREBP cleavage-activation family protein, partial [Vibrio harveyi]